MRVHRIQILPFLILFLLTIGLGCSGPGAAVNEVESETSKTPFGNGRYVWIDQSQTSIRDLATGEESRIGAGGQVSFSSISTNGAHVAIALTGVSGSRLLLIHSAAREMTELNRGRADLIYTGAWSQSGEDFVFGFYQPTDADNRRVLGQGDIRKVSLATGEIVRIGCSTSKAVIAWPRTNELIVRSTDNLYRVSVDGCVTLETMDIRRWHSMTGSPDGSHIAYIFRELAFNRDTREYEPDSALFVMPSTGGEGIKVVGDRYRPRNMVWSPDGSEIAFDARVDPASEQRSISVYNLTAAESIFLSPPTDSGPSQSNPRWGPEGRFVSFVQNGNQLVIRTAATAFDHAILLGEDQRSAKTLVTWLGEGAAIVEDATGSVWLHDVQSRQSLLLGSGTAIALVSSN